MIRFSQVLIVAVIITVWLCTSSVRADVFELAIAQRDVNVEACGVFHQGEPGELNVADMFGALGLERSQGWSAGQVRREWQGEQFDYVVAFHEAVEIGSVMWQRGDFQYLSPDAEYPGDPSNADDWVKPVVHPYQSGARIVTFPVGFTTRAVRITTREHRGRSVIGFLRLFRSRLHNVTPVGVANAEAEYTVTPFMSPPHTFRASDVVRGRGRWQNAGKDSKDQNLRPPVSSLHPSWFVVSWHETQTISGIWLNDNFTQFELHTFIGGAGMNPSVGTDREWRRITRFSNVGEGGRWIGTWRWVSFDPVETRGLKIQILGSNPAQEARIDGYHALVDLKDAPVPEVVRHIAEAAPYAIPYNMPLTGKMTMVIDGPDGRRVRNVEGLVDREAGENTEFWDLKREDGTFVDPGTYTWKLIAHEPLRMIYEMTPYPNIPNGNSPWLNGHYGPGGWMADHTPTRTVTTSGDKVWLGATCAESGVSFIEVDFDGKKHWGYHSFAAWTGPSHLAADDETVFVAAAGGDTDRLWQMDIESREVSGLMNLHTTSDRSRGLQGMAARDGKLYISFRATDRWLTNATRAADVDILNCLPLYPATRPERFPHEVVPAPRSDFLRLFRLQGIPPGHGGSALTVLESTRGPQNRQHILLSFNREVQVGSIVFPLPRIERTQVRFSVLKPNAPYPPDVNDNGQWTEFDDHGSNSWECIPAPPGTSTRAIRISFVKGDDDIFSQVEHLGQVGGGLDSLLDPTEPGEGTGGAAWHGSIEGVKILRRRYVNLFSEAQIRVNSGVVRRSGAWDAERETPLSSTDPGIYVMEWEKPQTVRGLAIMEIDGRTTEIDIYTGNGADIDIEGHDGWEQVASYQQALRDFYQPSDDANPMARYIDGYVDFGRDVETRAIRLRVIEQWTSTPPRPAGVRSDRGGRDLDPTRCRIYGIAPLRYIGGEVPVDPIRYERVEVFDKTEKNLLHEVHVEKAGDIALNSAGELLAISGASIVKINFNGEPNQPIITDLKWPVTLAVDSKGWIYVFDGVSERKNIRVYNENGEFQRTIGTPGGYVAGPWDPTRFNNVTKIEIDASDQLWAVEYQNSPKRVTRWQIDGTFLAEHLGNTQYGGDGLLDPWDKTRLFLGPLQFELDWETGETKLAAIHWLGGNPGEVPIRINDRTFLVTRTNGYSPRQPAGFVYIYEEDVSRLVAVVGEAGSFGALKKAELSHMAGRRPLSDYIVAWSDLNNDGIAQEEEIQLVLRPQGYTATSIFNRDLSIQAGQIRFAVKDYTEDGIPIYEIERYPLSGAALYRLDTGNFHRMDSNYGLREGGLTPEGETIWTYPSEGSGVHSYYSAAPMHSAQVVSQFCWIGHETAHAGDLGEFVVMHSNIGVWNIWTSDGMLAGRLFREVRDPQGRPWSMREHDRRMELVNLRAGQEHFNGYFCRSFEDDKYYIVAGHNHASVVEIEGIDGFRRASGEFTVSVDDMRRARQWEMDNQHRATYERARVIDSLPRRREIRIDGDPGEWEGVNATIGGDDVKFRITYDDRFLYVCFEASGMGPLRNTGEQWDRLFKTGASVDLQMGVDPNADPGRRAPVEGDFRLLMTMANGRPMTVMYRPVVPGTPEDQVWEVVSPVFTVRIDEVRRLNNVRMSARTSDNSYVLEAAIPLSEIGLKITPGLRLKMDFGVLTTGPDGNEVMQRVYWSNKATAIISDAPSEALITPDLWGYIRFGDRDESRIDPLNPLGGEPRDSTIDVFMDDILEELK